jgi:hypothetical protein
VPQSERSDILKQLLKWLASSEHGATVAAIRQYTKWEITEGGATDNTIKKYIEDLGHAGLIEYKQPYWIATKFAKDWLERHSI